MPGMPNAWRTPSARSAATTHSPPVRVATVGSLDSAEFATLGLPGCLPTEEGRGQLPGHLAEGTAGRALAVIADERAAPVGPARQPGVEGHATQERDTQLGGRPLAPRAGEEGAERAALEADVAGHVLDEAEERGAGLAGQDD